jgi:hypothetical protein
MKRKVALFCILLTIITFLTNCQSNNEVDKNNMQEMSLTNLIKYRDSDVGNNFSVFNIISKLPGALYVKQISTQTEKPPFGISVSYGLRQDTDVKENDFNEYWNEKNTEKIFLCNATTLFILIKNVSTINFKVNNKSFSVSRKELNDFYGKDISQYTNKLSTFNEEILKKTLDTNKEIDSFFKTHSMSTN